MPVSFPEGTRWRTFFQAPSRPPHPDLFLHAEIIFGIFSRGLLIHHGTPTTSLLLLSTNSVSSRLDGPTFSFGSFFLLPFFSLIPTTATNRRSFGGTHAGGTTVGRSQGSRKRVPPAPCYPAFSSSRSRRIPT